MTSALIFIIQAVSNLFLFILLLRFWLPWFRADFRNPVAQGILKLTSPLIVPLRRVIPSIGKLDTATIVVAFAVQYLTILIILLLYGISANAMQISLTAILDLGRLSANLFILIIIVTILLGWFAPGVYNPVTALVGTIAQPLLKPFRRFAPPLGGFDISPVIPLILLGALVRLLGEWRPLPI